MKSKPLYNFLISGTILWMTAIVQYAAASTPASINRAAYENQSIQITPDANNILYVNIAVTGGTGDGSSWENAITELADALRYARTQYDADNTVYDATPLQIYVAKGTYKPLYNAADSSYTMDGGRDNAFVMVKNVHIYGGFDPANNITELTHNRILPDENTSVVDGTILSGDIGTLNDESDNAYHVVFFSGEVGSALLNGVSITQGKANGTGNIIVNGHKIYRDSGGGIYNCYSSPALTHISISDNSARTGGGISNSYSDPTLAHVGISGNIARYGGGIYNSDSDPTLTHVSISGNNGYSGGGLYNAFSTPLLTHVNVSANTASEEGGGIYNEISSPKLTYVNIRNNTAKWGGGMSNNVILMHNYTPSSPILKHVRITGNTADYGGGMSNLGSHPVLVNVIISENSGSAICNDFNSNPVLINVSITANMGGDKSGGIVNYMASSPRVYNSIIYGNGTTSVYNNVDQYNEAIPQFYNSWIEGSGGSTAWDTTFGTDGGNNLDATSLPFTDAANGDYSLAPGSPAIDGGNRQYWLARGSITGNETDLAGNPRIVGANIDMGAYEDQTLTISPDASNILYVDKHVINPHGDGSSWESALPELADALQYARIQYNVDTTVYDATPLQIYVAKGTYKPLYNAADNSYTTYGGRDNSFVMVKNVQIYGGFDPANHITDLTHNRILPDENTSDGRTLSAVEGTILSGDISTHNNYAYHVVISSGDVGSALLNGVIITDGNANGSSSVITVNGNNTVRRNSGGGIYNFSSSPALTHVNITNNTANFGGGMFNESSPSPVLTRVNISNNTADHGGGMYNYTSSSPILTNVSIMNNRANYGGGMHNYASSPVLTNVNITANRAHGGGGMNNSYSSSPQVYNSIVYRNTALMADNVRNNGSTPQFYNSLIKGSGGSTAWDTAFGTDNGNNLDATTSPFTDAAGGDYSLAPGSPAINGGNNQYWIDQMGDLTGDETDLAGNPRIIGGSIDMGAYESTYENVVSVQGQVDITVPYGTVLDDLALPSTHAVETTLSNGNVLPADIDPNSTNWTYVSGGDGQGYDALRAGSYIFHAKLVAPDISSPDWYSNTQQLKVEIQITVEKGTPQLSSAWNGASIDTGIGIALTYGDEGALGISHNNTDLLDDDADIALIAGDGVLNLANLDEVQTLMSGTGRLRISLPETDNFEETVLEFDVRVAPKVLTITAVDQQKTYGEQLTLDGTEFTVDGLLPMDEVTTASLVSDGFDAQVDVDTYTIVASAAQGVGLTNYTISYEEGTLTVVPKALTITADNQSKVYGSSDPALTYQLSVPLLPGDALTGSLVRETGENVGEYAIEQGNLSAGTNYSLSFVPAVLHITPATITGVTLDDASYVYDGTAKSLAIGGTLPPGTDVVYNNNSRTDTGTQQVTATITGGNYQDLVLTAELEITPATITGITFDNASFIYDGTARSLAISGTLPTGTDVVYSNNSRTDVGVQQVTATITGDNYQDLVLTAELEITPATITGVTFDNASFVYDGTAKSLAISGTLPIGTEVVYNNNNRTDVGVQQVTATVSGSNYLDLVLTAELEITPATITGITFDNASFVYDGTARSLAISGTLPIGTEVVYNNNNRTDVGVQQVTATVSGSNYLDLVLTAELEITPAIITGVTFDNASFVYDGTAKSLAIGGTLPSGTNVVYNNNSRTDTGTQQVTATITGSNYQDLVLTAELEITPATITGITFDNASFVYDGSAKSLAISGTLPIGTEVVYNNNNRTDVGVQQVTATITGDNYQDLVLTAELEITPATITGVTFDNASFVYDGSEKSLAISGTLPTGTDVIYSNNSRTDVGAQEVTATISGSNYHDLVLTAELEIVKAPQVITFSSPGTLSRDAGTVPLEVSSSSGLPVTLAIDDTEIAQLDGHNLIVKRLGSVNISATQTGNNNYLPAETVVQTIRIAPEAGAKLPIRVHQAVSPNGDGINDYLMIEGIADYPENRVTIFDKSGKILAEIESYNNRERAFTGEFVRDGTYYYYLDVKDGNTWKREKGFFVVRR